MSCGSLNGLLTSSLNISSTITNLLTQDTQSLYTISLTGNYNNSTINSKFAATFLNCSSASSSLAGLLSSSLECENFIMSFGTDTTNLIHGYSLEGKLTSSLEMCIFPWYDWVLT
jgi:hypothetical protein